MVVYVYDERIPFPIGRLNLGNAGYAHLSLALDRFTLPQKTLSINMSYGLSKELEAVMTSSGSIGDVYITAWAPDPLKPFRYPASLRTVLEGTITVNSQLQLLSEKGVRKDADITLSGDEFLFPFDTYMTNINAGLRKPNSFTIGGTEYPIEDEEDIPFAFSVVKNFRGYIVTAKSTGNDSLLITVQRGILDKIIFVACMLPLIWVAFWFLLASLRKKIVDLPLLVGAGALLIGIPALRSAIVPSQIQIKTIVDWALLFPLTLLICGLFVSSCKICRRLLVGRS